jgi:hypothetical protein
MSVVLDIRRKRWEETNTAVEVAHFRYRRALSDPKESRFTVKSLWDAYIIAQREEAKAWREYEITRGYSA